MLGLKEKKQYAQYLENRMSLAQIKDRGAELRFLGYPVDTELLAAALVFNEDVQYRCTSATKDGKVVLDFELK